MYLGLNTDISSALNVFSFSVWHEAPDMRSSLSRVYWHFMPLFRFFRQTFVLPCRLPLKRHQHALQAQIAFVGLSAEILADARLLEAAGGNDVIGGAAIAVDPHRSRLSPTNGAHRPAEISCMY